MTHHSTTSVQTKEYYNIQAKKVAETWKLFNLQIKTQAEAVTDVYTTVCEVLPPVIQSLQILNRILWGMNINVADKDEKKQNDQMLDATNNTISTLSDRLQLLTDHHQKLQDLMSQQNSLLVQGMNSISQILNE
ncbi:unnamed protein product [Didymodactylos carnosus]|uniref:Uncharacterized protein n=1 Tax=Didymodactylos carnosus TaxID=1234261 RepID=A0A8S2X8T5_9BILA|nr:unnamed protein product [Didymodactylos carnosus]